MLGGCSRCRLIVPMKKMVTDLPFLHFLSFIHFFMFTICFFLGAYSSMVVDSFLSDTGCPESKLKRSDVPAHPGDSGSLG